MKDILTSNNKYTKMQKEWYEGNSDIMNEGNHIGHNDNPDYWNILLKDIKDDKEKWQDKCALDFGAGCGRNVINLLKMADWKIVAGTDISYNNLVHITKNVFKEGLSINRLNIYLSNGIDLETIPNDCFDFVMSTIVFQHICVHQIRYNLMQEIYRVMKENGIFSFQMGFDPESEKLELKERFREYYDNFYDAIGTNSNCDTMITNPNQIVDDLVKIGFKNVSYQIREPFSDQHQNWIFIRCEK